MLVGVEWLQGFGVCGFAVGFFGAKGVRWGVMAIWQRGEAACERFALTFVVSSRTTDATCRPGYHCPLGYR
jgi:hypothetical protein